MALIPYLFEDIVCYLRALIALVGRVHGALQRDDTAENDQADGSSVTY